MIYQKTITLTVLLLFLLLIQASGQAMTTTQPPADNDNRHSLDRIRQHLDLILADRPSTILGFTAIQAEPDRVDRVLRKLYQQENSTLFWLTEQGPGQKAKTLMSVLRLAHEDGLNPSHYHLKEIDTLWEGDNDEELAKLDLLLTLAMAAYVTDMREGRAVTCLLDPKLFSAARDQDIDIRDLIEQGLNTPDLIQFLYNQAPGHNGYQSLRTVLKKYRKIEEAGGWATVPAGQTIKAGMKDERLAVIADRLKIGGDLQPSATVPLTFDEQMVKAVEHFQYRFNLEQDGVIGKNTLAALNIPIQDMITTIILNMERWRWLPHTLDGRRILVNIAGFQMSAIDDEAVEITMPVIVGKVFHKTPVFSHTMTYIEFNPFWNIPKSIARNEMVPKMRENPSYLREQRIRIFDGWGENAPEIAPASINWQTIGMGINRYRLRQDSGSGNALGTVKFMFPNSRNIYMHDTPSHSLFKRTQRSFSHGCIRISQPQDLALHLLSNDDQGWSKERIKEIIATNKRTVISLKNPIPVHILYRTVAVDPQDNSVLFFNDIYGRDTLLAEALFLDSKPIQCRYSR